jgi:DNA adenine methylase
MSIIRGMTTTLAKPFVKWAGGKQALSDLIVERFPAGYETYFEPFLGGGSVLLTAGPNRAVVSDLNEWLISTYFAIRDDWRKVAAILDSLPNTKEDFLRIREASGTEKRRWHRAAFFIYLNKTCFRGLYRVNRQNQFNVPYGAYERRYYDPENLEAVAASLQTVEFRVGDFELAIDGIKPGDFVYFDPPYYKLGGFSDFNRYTANQFREPEQLRLAALCRELDNRGIRWLLSNSDTKFVRSLFNGFRISEISSRRDINLHSHKRDVVELIVSNY